VISHERWLHVTLTNGTMSTPVTEENVCTTIERLAPMVLDDDATWTTIEEQPHT